MSFPRPLFRLALIATLGLCPLLSQAQQMKLQFITFPVVMMPVDLELYVGEGKTVELKVPSNEISQPILVPRMQKLILGRTVLNEEEEPTFQILGQCDPVAAREQVILILRKGKKLEDGLVAKAIAADDQGFGGDKIMFLNASSIPVGGEVGKTQFGLNPGKQIIIQPKEKRDKRLVLVKFFYSPDGKKSVPFFDGVWPLRENNRGMVFFFQDPKRPDKINFHSIRDFLVDDN